MSAAGLTLLAFAALMFGYGPAFCAIADRRIPKPASVPFAGLTSGEWDELTALQDRARAELESTPIHDRLVCEEIEKAEGWAS